MWDTEIPLTFITSEVYSPSIKNVSLLDVINFNLKVGCNTVYNFTDNYILFEDYYKPDIVKHMFDNYLSLSLNYL